MSKQFTTLVQTEEQKAYCDAKIAEYAALEKQKTKATEKLLGAALGVASESKMQITKRTNISVFNVSTKTVEIAHELRCTGVVEDHVVDGLTFNVSVVKVDGAVLTKSEFHVFAEKACPGMNLDGFYQLLSQRWEMHVNVISNDEEEYTPVAFSE